MTKLKHICANGPIHIEMRRGLHRRASYYEWTTEPVTSAKMNLETAPEIVKGEAREEDASRRKWEK